MRIYDGPRKSDIESGKNNQFDPYVRSVRFGLLRPREKRQQVLSEFPQLPCFLLRDRLKEAAEFQGFTVIPFFTGRQDADYGLAQRPAHGQGGFRIVFYRLIPALGAAVGFWCAFGPPLP